jgi:hypothetical protein
MALRKPHRLLPALLAGALCVAWPLETGAQYRRGDRSRTSDAPSEQPWTPPVRRGDDGGGLGTALIIGLIGGAALCAAYCKKDTKKPDAMRDQLLRDGPQIPEEHALGTLTAYGFVRNNWPVVLDYETAEGADTTLTITVGERDWSIALPGGRQQVKLRYEGNAAQRSTPALFVLRSSVWRSDGTEVPQDITLMGLGCGPRAVGSVAINNLSFQPSARRLGEDYARFGYAATSPFNRVGLEILRYEGRREGRSTVITVTPVSVFQERSRPRGIYGPRVWDGVDQTAQRGSRGLHRLRVRGWETDGDESWVAAISRDVVEIP